MRIRLKVVKGAPSRPERGLYLAVIGVLLGSLLFVMNENGQMRYELHALPERAERKLQKTRAALASQQQIHEAAVREELREAQRLIADIGQASEDFDHGVTSARQVAAEMEIRYLAQEAVVLAQKQAQGYYQVAARAQQEKREAKAKGVPFDSSELDEANWRFLSGDPYPLFVERMKDFNESAKAYAEGMKHHPDIPSSPSQRPR